MLITGVTLNVQLLIFLGINLVISSIIATFFAGKIRRSSLIFIITLLSLAISASYETISLYPLGDDVHGEYYIIKETLREGDINISRETNNQIPFPPYYYEIFSFIASSAIISHVTGLSALVVIKIIWNSLIIGLIPLMTFLYAEHLTGEKPAFIASILILVQSTYITTLHSTVKQTSALFMTAVILLFLSKYIEKNSTASKSLALIISVVSFIGYHYLTSGMLLIINVLAVALPALIHVTRRLFSNLIFKPVYLISIILTISWLFWYFLIYGSLITPIVDLVERLFYLQSPGYSYELIHIPLPVYLNNIRLALNAVIVLVIIVSGLKALIRLSKNDNFIDSMIVVATFLFLVASFAELSGVSTLGIGRLSIILMLIVSPYFYDAFSTLSSKIFLHKKILVCLSIAFILGMRMLLSSGVLPYIAGSIENSIFLDPAYKFEVSMSYADIQAANFINKYANPFITVGTDLKSGRSFIYIENLKVKINKNYFSTLARTGLDQTIESAIYFSSYNILKNIVQISVVEFRYLNDYTAFLTSSRQLIYHNGYSVIFFK
jgi:hypothetical protein